MKTVATEQEVNKIMTTIIIYQCEVCETEYDEDYPDFFNFKDFIICEHCMRYIETEQKLCDILIDCYENNASNLDIRNALFKHYENTETTSLVNTDSVFDFCEAQSISWQDLPCDEEFQLRVDACHECLDGEGDDNEFLKNVEEWLKDAE